MGEGQMLAYFRCQLREDRAEYAQAWQEIEGMKDDTDGGASKAGEVREQPASKALVERLFSL